MIVFLKNKLHIISLFALFFSLLLLTFFLELGYIPLLFLIVGSLAFFSKKKAFSIGIFIVLLFSFLSLYSPLTIQLFISSFDHRLQDTFFRIRGGRPPTKQVVVVDIDQKSLEAFGQWPWPRTQLIRAVKNLQEDGAKVIGFDILFAEKDRFSLEQWLQRFKKFGLSIQSGGKEGPISEYKVTGKEKKKILLEEWKERLSDLGVDYEEAPGESLEQSVVRSYLTWREEKTGERLNNESALLEMAQASHELFFLSKKNDESFFESDSQLILNNDKNFGEIFGEGKVVAGGVFFISKNKDKNSEEIGVGIENNQVKQIFPGIRQASRQLLNESTIQENVKYQGMFNIIPDESGVARSYALLMQSLVLEDTLVLLEDKKDIEGEELFNLDNYEKKEVSYLMPFSSLALEMYKVGNSYESIEFGYFNKNKGLFLKKNNAEELEFVPLDYKGDLIVNFLGYGGRWQEDKPFDASYYFDYYSLSDVIKKTFKEGSFLNKYVIIGSANDTLSDLIGSPYSATFPGVEVHATVLDNIIKKDFLFYDEKEMKGRIFLFILIGGVVLAFIFSTASARIAAFLTLVFLGGLPCFCYFLFAYYSIVVPLVLPWFFMATLSSVVVLFNFFIEGKEKRFVVSQFSKMVSPNVLEKLRKDPKGTSLSGQKVQVSVLFSDIVGFTSISENLEPTKLVAILNEYFTGMTDLILKREGFIDKFIGDAIMGCWGIPLPDKKHAEHACFSALEQQEALVKMAPKLKEKYNLAIKVRMGIASGEASAALIGSETRKSYTVMGDTVNLAARLEPICKDYEVSIIICEDTYRQVKGSFEVCCLDKIRVKGRDQAIFIYELIGLKGKVDPSIVKRKELFERALDFYWKKDWKKALVILDPLCKEFPDNLFYKKMQKRIKAFQVEEPEKDWDGTVQSFLK